MLEQLVCLEVIEEAVRVKEDGFATLGRGCVVKPTVDGPIIVNKVISCGGRRPGRGPAAQVGSRRVFRRDELVVDDVEFFFFLRRELAHKKHVPLTWSHDLHSLYRYACWERAPTSPPLDGERQNQVPTVVPPCSSLCWYLPVLVSRPVFQLVQGNATSIRASKDGSCHRPRDGTWAAQRRLCYVFHDPPSRVGRCGAGRR